MRGIFYLLPLCVFCLGWSGGRASHFSHVHAPLSSRGTFNQPSQIPSATATPAPDETDPEGAPLSELTAARVSTDWQGFDDAAHGLTIFYPPRWFFFDAAQELTLPEEMTAPARAAVSSLLMQLQSIGPMDSFIGCGFASPQDDSDLLHVNNVVVEIFPSKGLTLYQFGQDALPRSWTGGSGSMWTVSSWSPDCGLTGRRRFRFVSGAVSLHRPLRGRF